MSLASLHEEISAKSKALTAARAELKRKFDDIQDDMESLGETERVVDGLEFSLVEQKKLRWSYTALKEYAVDGKVDIERYKTNAEIRTVMKVKKI